MLLYDGERKGVNRFVSPKNRTSLTGRTSGDGYGESQGGNGFEIRVRISGADSSIRSSFKNI